MLKIWLINPHDAIPGETWGYRHGIFLSEMLANSGYNVTYWASNFSHALKKKRYITEQTVSLRYRTKLVPVLSYYNHVSFRRLFSLLSYTYNFFLMTRKEPKPDVIIVSMPTPFTDLLTVYLAKKYHSLLISDFRDIWPEIFLSFFHRRLQFLGKLVLSPFFFGRKFTFANSNGITSVCKTYLSYSDIIAPNTKNSIPKEIVYSTGIDIHKFYENYYSTRFDSQIPEKKKDDFWVIYAGTLGNNYDIPTLIDCVKILDSNERNRNIKILVAGNGPMKEIVVDYLEQNTDSCMSYIGVLNLEMLSRYYFYCDIALCLYSKLSTVVIPAKTFDYYAAGLSIVHSVKGEYDEFISLNQFGISYEAGNPESLVNSVKILEQDKDRRETAKIRMKSIANEFDRNYQYQKYVKIINEILVKGKL